MINFIEVNNAGAKRLINLRNVQEIIKYDSDRCKVFFSETDYFAPDESYDDIKNMLRKAGQYLEGHKKHD